MLTPVVGAIHFRGRPTRSGKSVHDVIAWLLWDHVVREIHGSTRGRRTGEIVE